MSRTLTSRRAAIAFVLFAPTRARSQTYFLKISELLAYLGGIAAVLDIVRFFFPPEQQAQRDPCPVPRARASDIANEVAYMEGLVEEIFGSERTFRSSMLYRYADHPNDMNWTSLRDTMFILADRSERLGLWAERVLVTRLTAHDLFRVRTSVAQLSLQTRSIFIEQASARISPDDARQLAAPGEEGIVRLRASLTRAQVASEAYLNRVSLPGVCA